MYFYAIIAFAPVQRRALAFLCAGGVEGLTAETLRRRLRAQGRASPPLLRALAAWRVDRLLRKIGKTSSKAAKNQKLKKYSYISAPSCTLPLCGANTGKNKGLLFFCRSAALIFHTRKVNFFCKNIDKRRRLCYNATYSNITCREVAFFERSDL